MTELSEARLPHLDIALAAGANLRQAVHQVRRAFDAIAAGAGALLSSDGGMVSLASAEVAVDVEAWNAPILRSHLTPRRTKGKTNG